MFLLLVLALPVDAGGENRVFTLAFGSCLKQDRPAPVWEAVFSIHPEVFVFAGDAFYADTRDPDELAEHWQRFAASPILERLRRTSRVFAVWDDHDYGGNDAGADYPLKNHAHRFYRDTFRIPPESRAWRGPGIFDAHLISWRDWRIQLILLDTRSFRGPIKRGSRSRRCPYDPAANETDPETTLLGAAQWAWLEERLREPADLRLLVSSIQVIPDEHCWEKWGNFPHERERLFDLVRKHEASGLILLSGDRHFADISRLPSEHVGYPLYEITASGLNNARRFRPEPNRFSVVESTYADDHFGVIALEESESPEDLRISLQVRDVAGNVVLERSIQLGEIRSGARTPLSKGRPD